jgi:hypothetical protein
MLSNPLPRNRNIRSRNLQSNMPWKRRRGSLPRKRITRLEVLEPRLPLAGAVIGTVFEDTNENGTRDSGEALVAGVTVYLDVNDNERFDAGEPSDLTQASLNGSGGNYRITNSLPNSQVALRIDLDPSRVATPGIASSNWTSTSSEVGYVPDDPFDPDRGDTKVRDIVQGDFNGDGRTDTAVLQ